MKSGIDVIIPTWNEEYWLPRLLNSLAGSKWVQSVIVADNASDDRTRAIARAHGCRVVAGGRPARARNRGAATALADILLFVDADTVLPLGYLEALQELFRDQTTVAVYFRNLPLSSRRLTNLLYTIMDGYISALHFLGIVQGIGTSIAVRATAFRRLGGFPEDVAVGEDAYLLRRLRRLGKVRYIREWPVYTSSRRLRLDGSVRYICKLLVWLLLRLIHVKASVIGYRWERYPAEFAGLEDDILAL
jgi:glycosyltransferase involved in cell wall biosynthesis